MYLNNQYKPGVSAVSVNLCNLSSQWTNCNWRTHNHNTVRNFYFKSIETYLNKSNFLFEDEPFTILGGYKN